MATTYSKQFGLVDPLWTSVTSLLNLTADFSDQRGLTWSAVNGASVSGGWLNVTGGTQGISTSSTTPFAYGTSAFTVEGYVNFSSVGATQYIYGSGDNFGSGNLYIAYNPGVGKLRVVMNNASVIVDQSWSPTTSTDYHVAIVRTGGKIYHFINGTKLGTEVSDSTNISTPSNNTCVGVGHDGANGVSGKLRSWRVTIGTGRYTATFTPPTVPFLAA